MDLNLIGSIIALAGGLIAFLYGLYRSMNGVGALYFRILTFAVGCFTLGRLYEILYTICFGELTALVHLGQLGTLTMSIFMMTASRGTLDYMLDDRRREMRKYRLIPIIFPVVFIGVGVCIHLVGNEDSARHLIAGVIAIVMMITVYFEGKHLIFPDEGLEFAASMRITNASSLVFNFVAYAMLSAFIADTPVVYLMMGVISAICSVTLIISADKGVKKWQA
ncbi:MAG: hypothetical protein ILP08_00755 [Lachnospiraceae bacterium]|nr:hypothetical protein [Lachnospiraceae bacterium]